MRIMFYINTLAGGGAQRVMANLANMFVQNGDEVLFVTSFPDENEYQLSNDIKRINLSEARIDSLLRRNYAYVMGLRCKVKEEKPDVLISFMRQPNYRAVVATRNLDTKVLISVRCDPKVEYKGTVGKILSKYLLPLADGCIFQTEDAKKWFSQKLQNKSKIIPNAVKRDFFLREYNPVKGRIVTCGRLSEQKNHKLLIDAFCPVADTNPNAELFIYGDGPLKDELEQYVEKQGMKDRIKLMGLTNDVPFALSQANCFVLSSDFEGMPNALMEAMAAGVPCISTACPCGGPEFLIENEKSGLLVNVGDCFGLEQAIRRVLGDEEFAHNLAVEGKKAAEKLDPDVVFKQWKDYIYSFR